jgi:hypothetical protein
VHEGGCTRGLVNWSCHNAPLSDLVKGMRSALCIAAWSTGALSLNAWFLCSLYVFGLSSSIFEQLVPFIGGGVSSRMGFACVLCTSRWNIIKLNRSVPRICSWTNTCCNWWRKTLRVKKRVYIIHYSNAHHGLMTLNLGRIAITYSSTFWASRILAITQFVGFAVYQI